jgi:hypothetical protein
MAPPLYGPEDDNVTAGCYPRACPPPKPHHRINPSPTKQTPLSAQRTHPHTHVVPNPFDEMPPPLSLSLPSPPPPLQPLSLLPQHARVALSPPLSSRAPPSSVCSVVPARHSDYFDPRAPPPPPQRDAYGQPPPAPTQGGQGGRVFASYSIYKGKAALAFDPRPPQFVPLEVGRLWCGMRAAALSCFCINDGCSVRSHFRSPGRTRW